MPPMDLQTYVTDPKSIVNYMNCSQYIGDGEDALFKNFIKAFE